MCKVLLTWPTEADYINGQTMIEAYFQKEQTRILCSVFSFRCGRTFLHYEDADAGFRLIGSVGQIA